MTEERQIHWYALKVYFNKVFDVEKFLKDSKIESYIPCRKVSSGKEGKNTIRKNAIPSLMFFRSTQTYARNLQSILRGKVMVYSRQNETTWVPATIPEKEMNIFKLVISAGDDGLEYFEDDRRIFQKGEHVRVTGGRFKGAEGYIRRIKGNHRLIVALPGICAIATSYIPQCFLEKI